MDPGESSSKPGKPVNDRTQLVEKARAFLLSPDIRHESSENKRKFLEEKGLSGDEIDILIQEISRQPPPVPPRTYPLPPPSNLPFLLASLFRIITWSVGISGLLAFGYYRFLLPRITRSLDARHALKLHQRGLIERLQSRLNDVKKAQDEGFGGIFSQREPETINPSIKSLKDLEVDSNGVPTTCFSSVIRCAFLEPAGQKYSVDDLHRLLLEQFPVFSQQDNGGLNRAIARELKRSRFYKQEFEGEVERWSYQERPEGISSEGKPTVESLQQLRDAVQQGRREPSPYTYTFKSLTDLTAYLSKEAFATTSSSFRYGFPSSPQLSPAQEEVRREIRALKGLVLNRRSFAHIPSRPSSAPIVPTTSSVMAT